MIHHRVLGLLGETDIPWYLQWAVALFAWWLIIVFITSMLVWLLLT